MKKRTSQELNTSSLPDIMFAILFFFIAVGMVKAPTPKIDSVIPIIEVETELEETSRYIQVYIGLQDGELVAQVGYDTIVPFSELTETLESVMKDDPRRDTVLLRIDSDTGMGYIRNEIEPAILKANIKNVTYVLDEEEVQS